ncbi:head-tail connector protein [Bacillus sp. AG4(2022)]|uniref:head-tail connector protein n=1 Tax=Bacillus sp. AG4(2022) TaxID=2962594 RepID=UPI002882C9E2|nr:head-tail connector protein [Bacillus sp. AG4(2022)]MDT0163823.1 head-tail connector protein [Bacillus sp. AG4(2022)]
MLAEVKTALRVTNNAFDEEIIDLIEEARHDLMLSGISADKANSGDDPLIKRAIKTFAKANFGFDNPDADRLMASYDSLKLHLSLAGDYIGQVE